MRELEGSLFLYGVGKRLETHGSRARSRAKFYVKNVIYDSGKGIRKSNKERIKTA